MSLERVSVHKKECATLLGLYPIPDLQNLDLGLRWAQAPWMGRANPLATCILATFSPSWYEKGTVLDLITLRVLRTLLLSSSGRQDGNAAVIHWGVLLNERIVMWVSAT